jgi:hypothetical protein
MALSTKEVTAAAGTGGGLSLGAIIVWVSQSFVPMSALESLEAQVGALSAAQQLMMEDIEDGHKIAELRANIYNSQKLIADLSSRNVMYTALDQAGVITPDQRNRWTTVQQSLGSERADLVNLQGQLRRLQ